MITINDKRKLPTVTIEELETGNTFLYKDTLYVCILTHTDGLNAFLNVETGETEFMGSTSNEVTLVNCELNIIE